MAFLLDTNVLSELRKGERADARVRAWASATRLDRHWISVLSIGEIRKGIELLRPKATAQATVLERWLQTLLARHADSILSVDEAVAQRWGRLEAARSLPVIDGLLAATALESGLTLATRNVKNFRRTGVTLLNPFE